LGALGSDELRREACKSALLYAAHYNAFVEERSAQLALLKAWQAVVEVTITKR
jgi:hypothetical protein